MHPTIESRPLCESHNHKRCTPVSFLSDGDWERILTLLRLSPREAEIAALAMQDESVLTVAARLGISPHTVHTYRDRLFRKLAVSSSTALVVRLFRAYVQLNDEAAVCGDASKGRRGEGLEE